MREHGKMGRVGFGRMCTALLAVSLVLAPAAVAQQAGGTGTGGESREIDAEAALVRERSAAEAERFEAAAERAQAELERARSAAERAAAAAAQVEPTR